MRLTALLLCALIGVPACAETFAGRDYLIEDGRPDARPAPLVLVLHGGGGSGRQIRRSSGLDALARAAGIVAAFPSAPERLWNDGRWAALGRDDLAARDDVGWLLGLVDDLAARGIADPARTFVIGHSNGGGMALRLACARPDRFAGFAVVSTKTLLDAPCPERAPVPMMFFYGTEDRLAPHDGRPTGAESALGSDIGRAASAEATLADWAARNHCTGPGPAGVVDPADDGVTTLITDYRDCAAPLRYVEMRGGGHAWPGADGVLWPRLRRVIGDPIEDVDAGAAALAFWFGQEGG